MPLGEAIKEGTIEFKWGRKKEIVRPDKDAILYESFTYDGVEYFLYDCVYIWHDNEPEPYIGKLVKMWETASHKKLVKVVWFFRPIEIRNFLGDVKPLEKEIFLASGEGKGLFNLNSPEAISGKCNVVCTSKDKKNPKASEEELRMADYIFYRTFDVGRRTISHSLANVIAGTEVKHFFNREKNQKLISSELDAKLEEKSANSSLFLKVRGDKAVRNAIKDSKFDMSSKPAANESKIPAASLGNRTCSRDEKTTVRFKTSINKVRTGEARIPYGQVADKAEMIKCNDVISSASSSEIQPLKKRKVQFSTVGSTADPAKLSDTLPNRAESLNSLDPVIKNLEPSKGVNFHGQARKTSDTSIGQLKLDRGIKSERKILEVTRRPGENTSKWFKQQPWEERMRKAYEKGTLVLLENLDPSFSSSEVEDLVWHAFNERVDAKMVQRSTFSSPHYGQAFVIFKSKDAAEHALSELNRKCLMLTNGRPVVGSKGSPKKPSDRTRFVGHLIIDKIRFQKQRDEMKNAVSTSHYSQPNTIEFEMALEWRASQEKSNLCWNALNAQQAKEIEELRSQLKL